jgi:tetratricopeptide (TPR) repeat protein
MQPENDNPALLEKQGKLAFERGQYKEAAEFFRRASQALSLGGATPDTVAEMNNNLSVALLLAGKPGEALEAALGADQVFAALNDRKRQGMSLGNQAAALEALGRADEALAAYDRSVEILGKAGEGDLLAMVKKSAAAIRLKRGDVVQSALNMVGSVEAKTKPSIFERILKFFLRFKTW